MITDFSCIILLHIRGFIPCFLYTTALCTTSMYLVCKFSPGLLAVRQTPVKPEFGAYSTWGDRHLVTLLGLSTNFYTFIAAIRDSAANDELASRLP